MRPYNAICWFLICCLSLISCSEAEKPGESTSSIRSKEAILPAETDSVGISGGIFDIPEIIVEPSPLSAQALTLNGNETVIDYDVSPAGPVTAVILKRPTGYSLKLWKIGENSFSDSCSLAGFEPTAIAWHPKANSLFLIAEKDHKSHVLRVEKRTSSWAVKSIFSTASNLRRLIICPRPFVVGADYNSKPYKSYFMYRLFLGMEGKDDSYRIISITETGSRFYQVVGSKESITHFEDEDVPASEMTASWALPTAFHPAGDELIWEDKDHNYFVANYSRRFWGDYQPLFKNNFKVGSITPTPNGIGLLHWQKDKAGIGVFLLPTNKEETQAAEYRFISTPSSVPDGKGIVGLTNSGRNQVLNYVPIKVPLADVINAWMYASDKEEMELFEKHYGLFRPNNGDQLYRLYDSENYDCGDYDANSPTRPYLVTTDIFWELFGAAYEGMFILKEREQSMGSFWNFINAANQYYQKSPGASKWAPIFSTLVEFNSGNIQGAEARNIQAAQGREHSVLLERDYDYSELKPRGHYTSSEASEKYFKAFKYFTTVFEDDLGTMKQLNSLPVDIKKHALAWINSYMGFISPPRNPLVWDDIKYKVPSYCQNPEKSPAIFPLSWGFDNEVLNSTVYHPSFPPEKQIIGTDGPRLLPSSLDLAAALGNMFADSLLTSDYKKYPPLKNVITGLKDNFNKKGRSNNKDENLYNQWLTALALQWTDTVGSPCRGADKTIWNVKRLQTGLASWATLRHATALVNVRTAAECGEAGFEEILMRSPRGYVEPDPNTFEAIAGLFDISAKFISASLKKNNNKENTSLYEGLEKRLKDAAGEARYFKGIAEKQIRGEELTNEEYQNILYTARVAEHYFLIFKSLASNDNGLADPDPIGKIADVAGGGPFLMSAVGNAMEWDHVVPFYGRYQIVKGSVYSYYEFSSEQLLNDKEWLEKIKSQEFLPWIKPFITNQSTTYPASTGY